MLAEVQADFFVSGADPHGYEALEHDDNQAGHDGREDDRKEGAGQLDAEELDPAAVEQTVQGDGMVDALSCKEADRQGADDPGDSVAAKGVQWVIVSQARLDVVDEQEAGQGAENGGKEGADASDVARAWSDADQATEGTGADPIQAWLGLDSSFQEHPGDHGNCG